jgi:C1A family cysteine protease
MNFQIFLFTFFLYHIKANERANEAEWIKFKKDNSKSYTPSEEAYRRKIWSDNIAKISHMNRNEQNFSMEINGKFGDLTEEESLSSQIGFRMPVDSNSRSSIGIARQTKLILSSVDWRQNGAVTPVKDQGAKCSACHVFAATASLESLYAIKYKKLLNISEQNFIDCAKSGSFIDFKGEVEPLNGPVKNWIYTHLGCQGGNIDAIFQYAYRNGFVSSNVKPYTGVVRKENSF